MDSEGKIFNYRGILFRWSNQQATTIRDENRVGEYREIIQQFSENARWMSVPSTRPGYPAQVEFNRFMNLEPFSWT